MPPSQINAGCHAVDPFDGVIGRRLKCARCRRLMPEDAFVRVNTAYKGARGKLVALLHPNCHTCRAQSKGKWVNHPDYSPELDRFWSEKLSHVKGNAKVRGLLVAVDKDDLLGKYFEQEGRCAISGLKMDPFKTGNISKSGKAFSVPSVDRIDSQGHYTLENIQIVMHVVNIMKGELPSDVFLELCSTIADKHKF